MSLRFLTGDGLPPVAQQFVLTTQQASDAATALHVNNDVIHREMDDSKTSFDTVWSSGQTAAEIASAGADQTLNTIDQVAFGQVSVPDGQRSTVVLRKGDPQLQIVRTDDVVGGCSMTNFRTRGTPDAPLPLLTSDIVNSTISATNANGNIGIVFATNVLATQDHTATAMGVRYQIATANNDSTANTAKLELSSTGTTLYKALRVQSDDVTTSDLFEVKNAAETVAKVTRNGVLQVKTGLQLGATSSFATGKCVHTLFQTAVFIPSGRVVKIVSSNGVAKVRPIAWDDDDATGVLGVTMADAPANADVPVCIGGIFSACVAENVTIQIGQMLEKSDVFGQDGKVVSNPASTGSPGTFAVALTGGTGNSLSTVFIRGIYIKNETF